MATYDTKNDLPNQSRQLGINLLQQRLADSIDLMLQTKQAHWNVSGPDFIALHNLFDEVHEDVREFVDLIAERIVQLGGIAEGTLQTCSKRTQLPEFPLILNSERDCVEALSDALARYSQVIRADTLELEERDDPATCDILTEVLRRTDKHLWMVESHVRRKRSEESQSQVRAIN